MTIRVPEGDHLPRHVCGSCAIVHYRNPNVIAGCIVTHDDAVLICRRAIEPRYGYWTLPAGYMELGESVVQAAAREAMEEACADVDLAALYTVVDVIHMGQVHMMYRGTLRGGRHSAGPESLETALVGMDAIPWDELAFPSVRFTLERFREDLASGHFALHSHVFDGR